MNWLIVKSLFMDFSCQKVEFFELKIANFCTKMRVFGVKKSERHDYKQEKRYRVRIEWGYKITGAKYCSRPGYLNLHFCRVFCRFWSLGTFRPQFNVLRFVITTLLICPNFSNPTVDPQNSAKSRIFKTLEFIPTLCALICFILTDNQFWSNFPNLPVKTLKIQNWV